jgi:hypothetical protein
MLSFASLQIFARVIDKKIISKLMNILLKLKSQFLFRAKPPYGQFYTLSKWSVCDYNTR